MARAATTSDVFNAIAEPCRRDILSVLARGEAPVAQLVDALNLTQPQVSKHLGVLRTVGAVRCRSVGRERWYRVHPPALAPVSAWMATFERQVNERLDRLDDYLTELQTQQPHTDHQENPS